MMIAMDPCSAIILSGGESKRFNTNNKALMEVGGQRVLDRLLAVLAPLFDEIILVTTHPEVYLAWDLLIVSDHHDCRSSLNGIHAGLFAAKHPNALMTACDMPFLQPALVRCLLQKMAPRWDVLIPKTQYGFEPLMAIYSKRCLTAIEDHLKQQRYQIQGLFAQLNVKTIEEDQLRQHDPDLISFFNINSPDELEQAEAHLKKQIASPRVDGPSGSA